VTAPFPDDATGEVLRDMQAHGVDFAVPHRVEFVLLFEKSEPARRCAQAIERQGGYKVVVRANDTAGGFDVQADREMLLSYDAITQVEAELGELAAQFGGHSDGWGVLAD
jgi:hypothetical protein